MKKATKSASGTVLIVILFVAISFCFPLLVQARSVLALEGVNFNVSGSIKDNWKTYVGKDVLIHLRSGKTFQGDVTLFFDERRRI